MTMNTIKLIYQNQIKLSFLTALFELITEIRQKRIQNDGITNDIHEQDLEFIKKVYESAKFVADYLGWDKVKCCYQDKMDQLMISMREFILALNINNY